MEGGLKSATPEIKNMYNQQSKKKPEVKKITAGLNMDESICLCSAP